MWMSLLKSIDPWEIFLPLVVLIGIIFGSKYISNVQIKIAWLLLVIVCIARVLFIISLLPLLWWKNICYLVLLLILLILFIVRFK